MLKRVYDLTKKGQTEEIESDFSIPKIFGAWSSILWALPHLNRFDELEFEDLKSLVKTLTKCHISYEATTNQFLRTETLIWIIGIFKAKAVDYGMDKNEGLYAELWASQLFKEPESPYQYNPEFGRQLFADQKKHFEINAKIQEEKQERLQNEVKENELRLAEKQKRHIEHLSRNEEGKKVREIFLSDFSKLDLMDKLIIITTDSRPLHYYPTDFLDIDLDTLKSLSFEQRTRLLDMIKVYRIKEWYDTKVLIEQLNRK